MDLIVTKTSSVASNVDQTKDVAMRLDARHSNMEATMTIIQNRLDQMVRVALFTSGLPTDE
jgi:hypothetical protein